MKKPLISLFLMAAIVGAAAPAMAGDAVDGDGYRLALPAGFEEAVEIRASGDRRIRRRFGTMPIDGVPAVKSFVAGSHERPSARLVLSRMNLKRPVTSLSDLGLRQIEAMEARVPESFEFKATKVGAYEAIEMRFSSEIDGETHSSRVLSVACGDYIFVAMLDTADARYVDADLTWDELVASIKIVPRRNRLILFGMIGLGVLGLCGLLAHLARRHVGGSKDPWNSPYGGAAEAALPGGRLGRYAQDRYAPENTPGSPGGKRPRPRTPPTRQGLRTTLENAPSGRSHPDEI